MKNIIHAVAIILVTVALASCAGEEEIVRGRDVTKIDIYYRSIGSLSPIGYTVDDLKRNSSLTVEVSDRSKIKEISTALGGECKIGKGVDESKMDLYFLVVAYDGSDIVWRFAASPFHYTFLGSGRVCVFDRKDRDSLIKMINRFDESQKREM